MEIKNLCSSRCYSRPNAGIGTERGKLIDNYPDETVLAILAKRPNGVKSSIHTRYSEKFNTDLAKFNKQYSDKTVEYIQLPHHNHDRFLIIDEEVYLLGASLKDLGNTWGAIIKMNETKKDDILDAFMSIPSKYGVPSIATPQQEPRYTIPQLIQIPAKAGGYKVILEKM